MARNNTIRRGYVLFVSGASHYYFGVAPQRISNYNFILLFPVVFKHCFRHHPLKLNQVVNLIIRPVMVNKLGNARVSKRFPYTEEIKTF